MIVAISGASGLVGSALSEHLRRSGSSVHAMRRSTDADGRQFLEAAPDCDGVVHLAGENIANGRWTPARKQRFRDSRIDLTRRLAEDLVGGRRAGGRTPGTLICASAIGLYGDAGDAILSEDSPAGAGFLADLVGDWESAADPAREAGMRVVHLRIGLVLSQQGGALKKMLTPFRLGLGGTLGHGRQWMSWIHIDDLCRMIIWLLESEDLAGAFNAVAPSPVTNREFTKSLGRVLHRPTVLPMPRCALRLLFGGMADGLLLASQRVLPERALQLGFAFDHGELESALGG